MIAYRKVQIKNSLNKNWYPEFVTGKMIVVWFIWYDSYLIEQYLGVSIRGSTKGTASIIQWKWTWNWLKRDLAMVQTLCYFFIFNRKIDANVVSCKITDTISTRRRPYIGTKIYVDHVKSCMLHVVSMLNRVRGVISKSINCFKCI